ncbi:IEV transmembrane phosphoprotein [Borealpox virus]|nr:IEV transmembrane phosphoprotein [Alaskapox virus]
MMLIPLITVTVFAGTALVCYILYICRKKICAVYNDNKIIMTKLKKIKSSNYSKSNDSESDWEDHCSAMEQNTNVDNVPSNNEEILDGDSFTDSLMWDNESNIIAAPSTEHIYDSVAGSMLLTTTDISNTQANQNITVTTVANIELQDNNPPINEDHTQNPNYSSNPFIDYNKIGICSKSNPFIAELSNKFTENNPFRRSHSEDYLNKQEQDRVDIESSVVSLV